MTNIKERFESYIYYSIDGCWYWTGALSQKGYGRINYLGRNEKAYRLSYQIHKGPIPTGLHVLHHCDNRACVNPDHLWLGDNSDNVRDRVSKNRTSRMIGDAHPTRKLHSSQVLIIREMYASGAKIKILASQYEMSMSAMHSVVYKKTWKHL